MRFSLFGMIALLGMSSSLNALNLSSDQLNCKGPLHKKIRAQKAVLRGDLGSDERLAHASKVLSSCEAGMRMCEAHKAAEKEKRKEEEQKLKEEANKKKIEAIKQA